MYVQSDTIKCIRNKLIVSKSSRVLHFTLAGKQKTALQLTSTLNINKFFLI